MWYGGKSIHVGFNLHIFTIKQRNAKEINAINFIGEKKLQFPGLIKLACISTVCCYTN